MIWLPREDQLRDALGDRFLRLESVTGGSAGCYAVVLVPTARHVDIDAERAYARALLSVLPSLTVGLPPSRWCSRSRTCSRCELRAGALVAGDDGPGRRDPGQPGQPERLPQLHPHTLPGGLR